VSAACIRAGCRAARKALADLLQTKLRDRQMLLFDQKVDGTR
jgi:hypothetical protein